jgi:UDP-glucose 4-epimerase
MAILMVGGAGYIGSHVSFYLHQKGYDVIILDNFLTSSPFNPSWATVFRADYADSAMLSKIFESYDISAVMHFAASTQVAESMQNPGLYYENNVAKTILLLNSMRKHGVKNFIFSSSCAVYGNPQFLPLTEEHPKNPVNIYGKTKLMIENVLEDYSEVYKDFDYVSLRYFNAAGALPEHGLGENHNPETHVIPLALSAAKTGKEFGIFGTDFDTRDGSCVRDYLHVMDIADAHWRAYAHLKEGNPSDVFNLGTGSGVTVKEIVNSVQTVSQIKMNIVEKGRRAGDPPALVADYSKVKNILKWQSKFSDLDFIIKSAFVYYNKLDRSSLQQERLV